MAFFKKFSLSTMVERFGQSFKRFPLAMLFTLFLTCFLIFLIHDGKVGDKREFFLVFYPATGALLAVALSLLTEDFKNKWVAAAVQVVVHVVWLVVSVYLSQYERFSIPQMIAVSATVAAIGLSIFLICFYRRNQDVPFWNFSIRSLAGLAGAPVICGALTLGLFALVESLKLLFDFNISDKVFGDIASVCMVLLAPGLFMNLIPSAENKYLYNVQDFSRFAKGVVQYLFIPLLCLYMITLYAYGIKILLQWSLPVGGVSYLVSGSMLLMVLLIYLTYPIQHLEGNKLFKRVTHWLPVVMLPLLALMTVAIARRLSDYGITVSRLYLLVFNVWCYAVCLWLIFTRNKRIWIIPASFALILFLISVGPQSIANITLSHLKDEARKAFTASGLTEFPLTGDQYEKWLQSVDNKTAAAIDGKLDYIQDFYRFEDMKDLVAKDAVIGKVQRESDASDNVHHDSYSNWGLTVQLDIPDGYRKMEWVDNREITGITFKNDKATIVINTDSEITQEFEINKRDFIALDADRWVDEKPAPLVLTNDDAMFVVKGFTLNNQGEEWYMDIAGLLMIK